MIALPTILYRCPGPFAGTPHEGKSTTFNTLGCSTQAEVDGALLAGWHETLPAAVLAHYAPKPLESYVLETNGETATVTPIVEPEASEAVPAEDRAALEALAKSLGIKVDGRWSDETLAAKIAAAQK